MSNLNIDDQYKLKHSLRVRWSEVDLQRIVFNPHYLTYFDIAITEYWRRVAIPYELTLSSLGGDLFVKKSTLKYHASAQFDEMIKVNLRCDRIGRSSMTFVGAITRNNDLLVEGEIVYVFADSIKKTSLPIPESFKSLINHFEQGKEITKLQVGHWQELKTKALDLRHLVFVQEQGVPFELEEDEYDEKGLHAVLSNELGLPVATARLIQKDPLTQPKTRQIGRMAVRKELRASGLGSKVLSALIEQARLMGTNRVSLHAQLSAKSFYETNGFTPVGGVFSEAGIDHIEMIKDIG